METQQTRDDRFKRLATNRTNDILKKLDILGNCSNRSSYYYTQEQIDQMFLAIERKLNEVKSKFKPEEKEGFSF